VDQPLGTGLSIPATEEDYATTEEQISRDMYQMLLALQDLFPDFNKDKDFYITGESYAGHYIPNIGAYLLKMDNPNLNLKGLAIGNGMITPFIQYPSM
jgi:cathepsin A (carboxypeptidase C)